MKTVAQHPLTYAADVPDSIRPSRSTPSWSALLRLYAPLEPWFDKAWKPGDFELVDEGATT